MQWGDVDEQQEGHEAGRGLGISLLAMPVRVEVSLTGAPWEFRARLIEAGADYCLLTLVSPCAPAMRRGATAVLHVGTLGGGDISFAATITDVLPRPAGLTFRCTLERLGASDTGLAARLNSAVTRREG
jgi:hypothetical protein